MDHQRWLINNGFANPIIQDNLFMYGVLAHPNIKEVELDLDALNKRITYTLYFESKMLNVIDKFNRLLGD